MWFWYSMCVRVCITTALLLMWLFTLPARVVHASPTTQIDLWSDWLCIWTNCWISAISLQFLYMFLVSFVANFVFFHGFIYPVIKYIKSDYRVSKQWTEMKSKKKKFCSKLRKNTQNRLNCLQEDCTTMHIHFFFLLLFQRFDHFSLYHSINFPMLQSFHFIYFILCRWFSRTIRSRFFIFFIILFAVSFCGFVVCFPGYLIAMLLYNIQNCNVWAGSF